MPKSPAVSNLVLPVRRFSHQTLTAVSDCNKTLKNCPKFAFRKKLFVNEHEGETLIIHDRDIAIISTYRQAWNTDGINPRELQRKL